MPPPIPPPPPPGLEIDGNYLIALGLLIAYVVITNPFKSIKSHSNFFCCDSQQKK